MKHMEITVMFVGWRFIELICIMRGSTVELP